ncbi:MAG TPA: hypothetical protein VIL46_07480, partial [Gemmataceae bacterium]
LQALMANTNNFVEELRQVVQVNEPQFARAVKEFTETVDRIGETFSEENRKNLNTSLGNVARASENFEKLTVSSDEALQQVRKMLQRLDESLTRADEVIRNLRDITKPAAERSERITANADATLERLNALLADVHAVVRLAARSDGTLQRLLGDPRLYAQLEAAACGVVKLIPRLEGVLADLEVFADKIARHPELLGVGGAVRPSGGLKEAPHAPIAYPR